MNKNIVIKSLRSREVLDSRGNPTVETEICIAKDKNTIKSSAIVPSGASTGKFEALELRDTNQKRYFGKGVQTAVHNTDKIYNMLQTKKILNTVGSQKQLDYEMLKLDGTENKSNLGANSILGSSMAYARGYSRYNNIELYESLNKVFKETLKNTAKELTSKNSEIENVDAKLINRRLAEFGSKKFTLPIPFANIINGGKHANNGLQFQEFMIAPIKAKSFSEATMMVSETYYTLKQILSSKYGRSATAVGDEGGFAPPIRTPETALKILSKAIKEVGYEKEVAIAMDPAASEFSKKAYGGGYSYKVHLTLSDKRTFLYYRMLFENFNIISCEDPFNEEDYNSFANISKYTKDFDFTRTRNIFGCKQIVGDDLLVTNKQRIKYAINNNLCNSLLLKVNQIGTVTEALESASLANLSGWTTMVSHRSAETEDAFISDLSVGIGSGQIKLGAPCRGERTAKYNRLLRIEEELGKKAVYNNL